jgi:predicted RNA binding protein YcfA (HicA-like mRNA interferase family)
VSHWPSTKANRVLAALLRIGWRVKRSSGGSHKVLAKDGWNDFALAFHERDEVGPAMLAKRTGLQPRDL